jgi:hypothetical protein
VLVPEKVVRPWYVEGNFIYENFKYIFQNPLWKKKTLPGGMSVCPYFWTSLLIGFVLFRLLLVPSILFLGKIVSLFGKPFILLDRLFCKMYYKIFKNRCPDLAFLWEGEPRVGVGALSNIIFFIVGFLLLIVTGAVWHLTCVFIKDIYLTQIWPNPIRAIMFWWAIVGAVLVGIVVKYRLQLSNCRVQWYLPVWMLVTIILTAILTPGLWGELLTLAARLLIVISVFLWFIITTVAWALKVAILWVCKALMFVVVGLCAIIVGNIILLAWAAAFVVFFAALSKICDWIESKRINKQKSKIGAPDFSNYAVTRSDWSWLIIDTFMAGGSPFNGHSEHIADVITYQKLKVIDDAKKSLNWESSIVFDVIKDNIAKSLFRYLFEEKIVIPQTFLLTTKIEFSKIKQELFNRTAFAKSSEKWEILKNILYQKFDAKDVDSLRSNITEIKNAFWDDKYDNEIISKFDSQHVPTFKFYIDMEVRKQKLKAIKHKAKTKRQAMIQRWCTATTNAISAFFCAVWGGVTRVFKFIRKIIYYLTIWWIAKIIRGLWQFLCYLAILVWAQKKKACPYFRFQTQAEFDEQLKQEKAQNITAQKKKKI